MVDARSFLKAGVHFHGHKCPAMPLGLRVGAAAMNRLGVGRSCDDALMALVELGDDHCGRGFADGIQMVTGCTLGKGNIRQLGYGKLALTLIDRTTGRAVRVVPNAASHLAADKIQFFEEYWIRGVAPSRVPDEVVDPLIELVLGAPEGTLLSVGAVHYAPAPRKAETCESFVCERCGEMVLEQYGRIVGGRKVCVSCEQALQAATSVAEQPQSMP